MASHRNLALLMVLFGGWAGVGHAQVHVGASRLSEGQTKAEIDGAVKSVSLWGADICNDSKSPVTVDKARVRNLMREWGVPVVADADGAVAVTMQEKTGFVEVIKRSLGYLAAGCLAYGIADADWRILGICGGFQVFKPQVDNSLAARSPDTANNLARFAATPHLDLAPGTCGEMTVYAAPDLGPAVFQGVIGQPTPVLAPAAATLPSFHPTAWPTALAEAQARGAGAGYWWEWARGWDKEYQQDLRGTYMNAAEEEGNQIAQR